MGQSSAGIMGVEGSLNLEVFLDEEAATEGAARIIAEEANTSISQRGRFVTAVSGDRTRAAPDCRSFPCTKTRNSRPRESTRACAGFLNKQFRY